MARLSNAEIAAIFNKYAALLEIGGAKRFRVRAYRNASRTIENLPTAVADMIADGEDLSTLPGIGDDLAQKIAEIVDTGELSALEALEQAIPRASGGVDRAARARTEARSGAASGVGHRFARGFAARG